MLQSSLLLETLVHQVSAQCESFGDLPYGRAVFGELGFDCHGGSGLFFLAEEVGGAGGGGAACPIRLGGERKFVLLG